MSIYFYEFDIGKIGIAENGGRITNLYFTSEGIPQDTQIYETPILKEAGQQLKMYLEGRLEKFTIPIKLNGTTFMKQVWSSLCEIPYGTTVSYKDVAINIGKPNAARAVGLANNRNPIPIFIPCHRVIGANGTLIGYSGGIELKKKLL
ncbi:cysteine methyltransferase [Clostridium carboxidivorans P7]|uniref:Methylated-DNA--protein-cysteine methyltransferase n=1 Tax=Clostridium carboxidivorans P7 TaxID=536227 RepID=C6PZR5_9CLOT|nr:cysteine methyltransferase [Clostridium carboxidivorans P7]EET85265.1 methylated-DNA/protein-cysteine methyltransferase [Clostridium carboxidivorans P7]EFG90154.1 6-O-methylguanine DNA methyltransferase, DNA binding domain protein [Clostridium carboxidivorans P7]